MKKSIFQIIIIFILLLGMNGIVLVTYQENNIDDFDYLPQKNNNTYDLNFELNNYNVFEIEEKSFPYFYKIEETTTYFDEKKSVFNYNYDISFVSIGENIKKNQIIGTYDGDDVISNSNGIVINLDKNSIVVIDYSFIYTSFKKNIYNDEDYHIGDIFDVYKNNQLITTAEIVNIDYLSIIDDCVEITLLLNNENQYFKNNTNIKLVKQGYNIVNSLAIKSSVIGNVGKEYENINKCLDVIYIEDGILYNITIELGLVFDGYIEIKSILFQNNVFNIINGKVYVRNIN